jgi:predicted nucleic acid-binding protein
VEEILAGSPADPARQLLESGIGKVIAPRHISPRLLAWSLGRGETAVLALALEREGTTVVIDDAAARKCASVLRIPMIGTLGVVARAKRLGRIESAAAVFQSLREAGFHLDEKTTRQVLDEIGERW